MKHNKRRGSTIPVCWFLLSVTMAFLLLRMTNGQPQVYFKANAPAVKSLPRIGRRSDLETFPLPLSPSMVNLEGGSWPEGFFFRDDRQRKQQGQQGHNKMSMGDNIGASSSVTLLDMDHIAPYPYFWRKLFAENDQSTSGVESINGNADDNLQDEPPATRTNIYRSRIRK